MQKTFSSIRSFTGLRVQYQTDRSFDDVMSRLRKHVGQTPVSEVIRQSAGAATQEEFEKRIEPLVGDSGFILFLEIKHGEWLRSFGIERRVVRLVFGNPLIAYTMLRHDIAAGLFAPVELLLFEDKAGTGSTIIYNLPSSLMVLDKNLPLLEAARALDQKMADLMVQVV